jgi:rubrerythrin
VTDTGEETEMNIFDCAISMEEDARAYYKKIADVSTIPEIKNLLTLLAEAEQEHRDILASMKESLAPQKAEFSVLKDAACVFRPLLGKRDLMEELKDDPDAYRHIVIREEEDVRFYEDLAAKAQDGESRQILLLIAAEERKHLSIVENIYSFVESPRNYLAWGEFSNIKEY